MVVRIVLATSTMAMVLLGYLSEGRGNIIIIRFLSPPQHPRMDCLDVESDYFRKAVEVQETIVGCTSPSIPAPIQPTELPPRKRAWDGLPSSVGFGSADSSKPTIDRGCQAALQSRYEFFLVQPLSWVCGGQKLRHPDSPSEQLLKVPIS